MIKFNIPPVLGNEIEYLKSVFDNKKICGDGPFTKEVSKILEDYSKTEKVLMTTSCTHALEMAAILCNVKPGDEVIMPSFTFVSTADAFVLRGAKCVFVDIRPDTMNIDENLIEAAITSKTVGIVPVHYAGVACEMNKILEIAKKYNLFVVEDAAQALFSKYEGKPLGTFGRFGCFSFHETKNLSMGEGGALLINDKNDILNAEIVREKGTNRSRFFRGEIDKYSWVEAGSSYLPSELNVAYLKCQLDNVDIIQNRRKTIWKMYYDGLKILNKKCIELPYIPKNCEHNAHMFYIKCKNIDERSELIQFFKKNGVNAVFHYIPLHTSEAGIKYGRFFGNDVFTTKESERLLRLPLHIFLSDKDVKFIIDLIMEFYRKMN